MPLLLSEVFSMFFLFIVFESQLQRFVKLVPPIF